MMGWAIAAFNRDEWTERAGRALHRSTVEATTQGRGKRLIVVICRMEVFKR